MMRMPAVILAGGDSRRWGGFPKALVLFYGEHDFLGNISWLG
jgi:molybdopterin-guanine dinucleotide biosynthesis protein A